MLCAKCRAVYLGPSRNGSVSVAYVCLPCWEGLREASRIRSRQLVAIPTDKPLEAIVEWQGPMWNDCGACNWHRRHDSNDPWGKWCAECERDSKAALRNLAANLRIAAALCRAFEQGQLAYNWTLFNQDAWKPGCRRSAP